MSDSESELESDSSEGSECAKENESTEKSEAPQIIVEPVTPEKQDIKKKVVESDEDSTDGRSQKGECRLTLFEVLLWIFLAAVLSCIFIWYNRHRIATNQQNHHSNETTTVEKWQHGQKNDTTIYYTRNGTNDQYHLKMKRETVPSSEDFMDNSTLPCEVFYQFVCKNFGDITHSDSWLKNITMWTIKGNLELSNTDEELRPMNQSQVMFWEILSADKNDGGEDAKNKTVAWSMDPLPCYQALRNKERPLKREQHHQGKRKRDALRVKRRRGRNRQRKQKRKQDRDREQTTHTPRTLRTHHHTAKNTTSQDKKEGSSPDEKYSALNDICIKCQDIPANISDIGSFPCLSTNLCKTAIQRICLIRCLCALV